MVRDNVYVFYEYEVKDGETPEVIAGKYYGNPEYHWVVLLFNSIVDPLYDWILGYDELIAFCEEKYGSIANTQSGIHHYEKIVETRENESGTITTKYLQVDANTYANLTNDIAFTSYELDDGTSMELKESRRSRTNWDYEMDKNEEKRKIRLLKREYLDQFVSEYNQKMSKK